ncbi:MAG: methyltransferase domain-containing protein [Bacteroidales bacterium]|nr:methyltransferase domain-containing protein [Bacteroidales bacterium]
MRIIRGKYGRRRFDVPGNISARPTTDFARENLFNVLENMIDFDGINAIDLFAGTGAISLEMVSRGAAKVTAVEKAPTQFRFIEKIKQQLNCAELQIIKGDALKFIQSVQTPVNLIFADPPYDMDGFDEIPSLILGSKAVTNGSIVVIEHSKNRDFSSLPGFIEKRVYGSVNFSIFRID